MDGEIIKSVKIVGGCPGNTLAVSALVEGKNINDVIAKLDGIQCGMRGTQCPDQLAKALKEIKEKSFYEMTTHRFLVVAQKAQRYAFSA